MSPGVKDPGGSTGTNLVKAKSYIDSFDGTRVFNTPRTAYPEIAMIFMQRDEWFLLSMYVFLCM